MTTLQEKVTEIGSNAPPEQENAGVVARSQREFEVHTALERIKNAPGTDKQKYINNLMADAERVVKRNEAGLTELRDARNRDASVDEIKEIFTKHPELIKARAYLVIGSGLANLDATSAKAQYFGGFLSTKGEDVEGSTKVLIDKISEEAKKEDVEEIHTACVGAVSATIEKYVELVRKTKEQSSSPANSLDAALKKLSDEQVVQYALGVTLKEDGEIAAVVDSAKAQMSIGNVQVGSKLIELWGERDKGESSTISGKGSLSEFARVIRETKGFRRLMATIATIEGGSGSTPMTIGGLGSTSVQTAPFYPRISAEEIAVFLASTQSPSQ